MKTAVVIVSGLVKGDNLREIEIEPGTNAGDVLRALNLDGYLLSKEGSAQNFAVEEDIYASIEEGSKLRATPIAEVGANFWELLLRKLGITQPPRRQRVTLKPARSNVRIMAPKAKSEKPVRQIRVEPDRRSLQEVRGWKQIGERLFGAYRTPIGSFVGEISIKDPQRPDFFILKPPKSLLEGSHGSCFRRRGKESEGRYFIHFGLSNSDIDSGIVAIETLIVQALNGKGM